MIWNGDPDELAAAVGPHGGEVLDYFENIGLYRVGFPTTSTDELVVIRDQLRAAGFDADIDQASDDPTTG